MTEDEMPWGENTDGNAYRGIVVATLIVGIAWLAAAAGALVTLCLVRGGVL